MQRLRLIIILILLPFTLFAKSGKKFWVIDPGHGGNDHGCETSRTMEKDINLRIAKRVAELVKANIKGVTVKMTRETDKYLTLDQRCAIANNANADLFLSIHVNYAPGLTTIRGTETFYGPQDGTADKNLERKRKKNIQKSELMAWMMQKYYGQAGRPISRGVKRERFYVVLYTEMPAILTEIGFLSTVSEETYMTSKEGSEEIAQCIYRGLKDYNETVDNDKIQRTLATLRNTGGMTNTNVVPEGKGPEKLETLLAESEPSAVVNVEPVKQEVAKAETEKKTLAKMETEKKDSLSTEPEELDEPLLFSVQIFSLRAKLQLSDERFKGQKDILVVERDGLYKYLCGTTKDYAGARKLLEKVRETFPDAFLVAYKGSRQISMPDAIELLPSIK